MVTNTTDAKYRADASYIAQQRIGQMWADPANAVGYLEADTDISDRLPGGLRTVTQPVAGQFQVTVGWTAPGETPLWTHTRVTGLFDAQTDIEVI
ncbi:MAG TPA: hypothetical protein PLW86_14815, partial [Rhodocyclaceae bacterium]|nr:hypothetical protein [Rhodocyclaceae bacterium]